MSQRDASPCVRTYRWIDFNPLEPDPAKILIDDIARALSHICRYNGHVNQFYSVAEHSLRVSYGVPPNDALWGLLHDAAEAYLGDFVSPLKHHTACGELYQQYETSVMASVCRRFGLALQCPASVLRADHEQLQEEENWLRQPLTNSSWWRVATMPPLQAELEFLNRFRELTA